MKAAENGPATDRWLWRLQRVNDAFGLVLALVLTTYVVASLVPNRDWGSVALGIAAGATSIVALVSSRRGARLVRWAIALWLIAIALAIVGAVAGGAAWQSIAGLIQILLLAVAMSAVLLRVVSAADIGVQTILGALSVYTVLGILFTYVYQSIDRLQDGAFFSGSQAPHNSDFLFFSYTTLTTTGYGNLVPAAEPGRMIAGLEMMVGQIFLVTLVAGLVSLWRPGEALRRHRRQT